MEFRSFGPLGIFSFRRSRGIQDEFRKGSHKAAALIIYFRLAKKKKQIKKHS